MESIALALVAFFGWGIGDIFGTISSRKIGGYSTTIWGFVIGLIFFTFYTPFIIGDLGKVTFQILLETLIIGSFYTIGMVTFYEGVRTDNSSLVGSISASFSAVAVLLSLIFLNETITSIQTIIIIIIFIGVFISSSKFSDLSRGKIKITRGIPLALISMASWGIYAAFIKIPVHEIGWFWPLYITYLTFPLALFYMKVRNIKLNKPKLKSSLLPILLASLLIGGAELVYNIAISHEQVSLVAPIAGAYPALYSGLAYFVFKDQISHQQVLGIILTLSGIIGLSTLGF